MTVIDLTSRRPNPGMVRLRLALARWQVAVEAQERGTAAWEEFLEGLKKKAPVPEDEGR